MTLTAAVGLGDGGRHRTVRVLGQGLAAGASMGAAENDPLERGSGAGRRGAEDEHDREVSGRRTWLQLVSTPVQIAMF